MSWRRFCKTFSRGLSKTSWTCLEDVLKMPWSRLENVLKTSWRRLEDVWPRQIYWSWSRRLVRTCESGEYIHLDQDVLKTKMKDVFKTSSKSLHQDEYFLGSYVFKSMGQRHESFELICIKSLLSFLIGKYIYIYISQALQLWKPFKVIFSCEI